MSSQGKRDSFPFQGLLINEDGGGRELEEVAEFDGFLVVPLNQTLNLSPETQDFLRHVKVRIIDGKLNRKQILGFLGGRSGRLGVAWPWMVIMFDSLLDVYAYNVDVYYATLFIDSVSVTSYDLETAFQNFIPTLISRPCGVLWGSP